MKRRTVTATAGRLDAVLAAALPVPLVEAQALISRGAVYLDGKRCQSAQTMVKAGQKLSAVLEEGGQPVTAVGAKQAPLVVLFEDEALLVVDKAAGVVAQPTEGRVGDSLIDLARYHLKSAPGLVHRLDRETSGVTIFGKTPEATRALAEEFREGRAKKRYLAVTAPGLPPTGEIDLPLSRDPSRPGRWRASKAFGGIDAVTQYVRLKANDTFATVELFPLTGRTHQLRAHLAGIGFPIRGDKLYGGSPDVRCLLHAQRLEVLGRTFEAPVPADLAGYLNQGSSSTT
ncbi:MAG: Ribosomal large subunit pseudouridine synthase [Myxococcaceae bacterium]|nr:Ribosomal large subunit pseudouridine synthase [Myxococcaceae bacterium]